MTGTIEQSLLKLILKGQNFTNKPDLYNKQNHLENFICNIPSFIMYGFG